MRKCPKCQSNRISKEKWKEAMPHTFKGGTVAALSKTGNLMCNECGFVSSSFCFPKKDDESFYH